MKKQVLVSMLLATSTLALVSGVYADTAEPKKDPCAVNASGAVQNPELCKVRTDKKVFQSGAEARREENKKLHAENSGAVREFHNENSGAIRDAVKSLTGTERDAFKDAKATEKALRENMSGMTLEQKLAQRDALEAAQKAKLEAKFANNPELLAARLAVYEKNKAKRDTIVANRSATLVERSALRVEQVTYLDTQVRANLSKLSNEKKAALITKIDEKIAALNSAKGITAESRDAMVKTLTNLKADIQASMVQASGTSTVATAQ